MANGLTKLTVQEATNQIAQRKSIRVTPTVVAGETADNDVMFDATEIPNAVSVSGGTAILQSAVLISSKVLTDAVDVVITSDDTSIGTIGATLEDVSTTTAAVADGICGSFSISNLEDIGVVAVGSKQNIGMVCKAASGSTNLHVWLIARGTTDWDVDTVVLRLGFVKD